MSRPAWSTSNRRSELPPDWWRIRARVKRRAGAQCEWTEPQSGRCPSAGTECDHIGEPLDHSESNLQWLCSDHHTAKTRADWSAQRAKLRHPVDKHPGLR